MKTSVQPPLSLTFMNYRHGGQDYLGLTVMLGFSLGRAGALIDQAEALASAVNSLSPYASQALTLDSGLAKARGEFLCQGAALAPSSGPVAGVTVSISVGDLRRDFLVLGERYDPDPLSAKTEPFEAVQLDWTRAVHDPETNPFGVRPGLTAGSKGPPLQSPMVFELDTGDGGRSSARLLRPACPLPKPSKARDLSVSGAYDQAWLEGAWPGFPADFDFSSLNLAQEPQILPSGHFRGDEPITVTHMNRERPAIDSALPGRRLRLILRRDPGPDPSFIELSTCLDTVWLFPNDLIGLAIWHSSFPTVDEKAREISLIMAALEDQGDSPRPIPQIAELAANGWPPAVLADVATSASAPKKPPESAPPADSAAAPPKPPEAPFEPPPAAMAPLAAIAPAAPAIIDPAALTLESKAELKSMLPEINRELNRLGLEPLTMEGLAPHLAREERNLRAALETAKELDQMTDPAEFFRKSMADMGWAPSKIASYEEALAMPVPVRSAFAEEAEFTKALGLYGHKFAALLGFPAEFGPSLAKELESVAKLQEGPPTPDLLKELLSSRPELQKLDLIGTSDEAAAKKGFIDQMAATGLDPRKAEELHASLAKLDRLPEEAKNLPQAEKLARLKALGPELDSALDLPPGSMAQNFEAAHQDLKTSLYQSPEVGEALKALAARNPGLNEFLAPLEKLRMASPRPFDSLADMAKAAGLISPALLLEIARIDPLNPHPGWTPIETAPDMAPPTAPIEGPPEGPAAPPPPSDALIFSSRAEVAGFLSAPGPKSLAKASLASLDLSGLDFSGLDLTGADLRETNLSGTVFKDAVLVGASLNRAAFDRTDLAGADLSGADLTEAKAASTDFTRAKLNLADLSGADLSGLDALAGLKAEGAVFSGSKLPKNLKGAKLSRAFFRNVNLDGADLDGVDLSSAEISSCGLKAASLRNAALTGLTVYGSDLSQAKLVRAKADQAKFLLGCDLSGCVLTLSHLTEANFTGAKAPGADFRGVKASGANFSQIDLSGAAFVGAFLRQAVLFRADLSSADLRGADLFKASLGGANLRGADLTQANLYGADLYRVAIDRATSFKGADLNSTCLILGDRPVVRS